jgi:hypothetical protein
VYELLVFGVQYIAILQYLNAQHCFCDFIFSHWMRILNLHNLMYSETFLRILQCCYFRTVCTLHVPA